MAITKLYSERQKELRGEDTDVYVYDKVPDALRNQIWMIVEENLGDRNSYYNRHQQGVSAAYDYIVDTLRREYGVFELSPKMSTADKFNDLRSFLLKEPSVDKFIDAVEIIAHIIDSFTSQFNYRGLMDAREKSNAAIAEINHRFKRAMIGFEYVGNEVVRIDSEFVHVEAVKPALVILRGRGYSGAQQEFLSAFEHYRHGRAKEALVDCLKSFESTMKAICEKRGWIFSPKSTAKDLIQICLENELVPKYWQQHFSCLRAGLESGIPTARNRTSGHGQGVQPTEVPEEIASYMLHMTASTILFLARSEERIPSTETLA